MLPLQRCRRDGADQNNRGRGRRQDGRDRTNASRTLHDESLQVQARARSIVGGPLPTYREDVGSIRSMDAAASDRPRKWNESGIRVPYRAEQQAGGNCERAAGSGGAGTTRRPGRLRRSGGRVDRPALQPRAAHARGPRPCLGRRPGGPDRGVARPALAPRPGQLPGLARPGARPLRLPGGRARATAGGVATAPADGRGQRAGPGPDTRDAGRDPPGISRAERRASSSARGPPLPRAVGRRGGADARHPDRHLQVAPPSRHGRDARRARRRCTPRRAGSRWERCDDHATRPRPRPRRLLRLAQRQPGTRRTAGCRAGRDRVDPAAAAPARRRSVAAAAVGEPREPRPEGRRSGDRRPAADRACDGAGSDRLVAQARTSVRSREAGPDCLRRQRRPVRVEPRRLRAGPADLGARVR